MSQHEEEQNTEEMNGIPALRKENYLNLGAFVLNAAITYGSLTGAFGLTNTEASKKYQLIITPAGWAFAIWSIIFVGEGIFAVGQMFPKFRNERYVIEMSWPWIGACAAQSLWAFAFAQEVMWLALILIVSIGINLYLVVYIHEGIVKDKGDVNTILTKKYFWMFMAVFRIHFGWICAAATLNVNIVAVASKPGSIVPLETVALLSLVILPVLGCFLKSNVILSCVLSWASFAIYSKLRHPMQKIMNQYGEQTVSTFRNTALFLALHFLVFAILSGVYYLYTVKKSKHPRSSSAYDAMEE